MKKIKKVTVLCVLVGVCFLFNNMSAWCSELKEDTQAIESEVSQEETQVMDSEESQEELQEIGNEQSTESEATTVEVENSTETEFMEVETTFDSVQKEVEIRWSDRDCELLKVNGLPVAEASQYENGGLYPVGTTLTFQGHAQSDNGQFLRWGIDDVGNTAAPWHREELGNSYAYYKDNFDDMYQMTTTFTVKDNIDTGAYVYPLYEREGYDEMVRIDIPESREKDKVEYLWDDTTIPGYYYGCHFVNYSGDRISDSNSGYPVYYSIGSKLTLQAHCGQSGSSYMWFLLKTTKTDSYMACYYANEHSNTLTLEVTQEMKTNESSHGYSVVAIPVSEIENCRVYANGAKIVSADGIAQNTDKGIYKPGTVLEIEADRAITQWQEGIYVTGGVYIKGNGNISRLSEKRIQYVVPQNESVTLYADSFNASYGQIYDLNDNSEVKDSVESFVRRLYENILQRSPDASGLSAWTDVLKSGKESGAKVAQGFVSSVEFQSRNMSNEEFIKIMYSTFLGREYDSAGLNAWISVLDSGLSRMHVFKGFAESQEFSSICDAFGIIRGSAQLTEPRDQNEGVTKFIVRNYRLCLGRDADIDGLNAWCSQILNKANTAKEAAYGFVFSNEFKEKGLSDEEFIRVLYKVFMDREADPEGLAAWMKVLTSGKDRKHVFDGFADSVEFRKICQSFGIE